MDLKTPLRELSRMFSAYDKRLEKLGIVSVQDLLYHIPFRYEDYSLLSTIARAQPGEIITIQGVVTEITNAYTRSFKTIQKAIVQDATGSVEAIWFNQPYLTKVIRSGDRLSLSGRVGLFSHGRVLESPEYEIPGNGETIHTGRLVPIYPETKGVSSKWLRRQIYMLLKKVRPLLTDYLPQSLMIDQSLPPLHDALKHVHFPLSLEDARAARDRLAFDELFLLHLSGMTKKQEWEQHLKSHPFAIAPYRTKIQAFWDSLPFSLTAAQKQAVREIFHDLAGKKPMNRLLEGDVGSGKTVVSAIAMYLAYLNGFQSVLMTPTEILAQQHFTTINNLLSPCGLKIGLATGSKKIGIRNEESGIKNKKKPNSKFQIRNSFNVLVGTHAVLSKRINFARLGLVVIDEQQRFGVKQRGIIRQKGKNPHLLTMTATPIPRTVALTLYGDLDLSYLGEMPKGRKNIKTWLVPSEKRKSAYRWIEREIQATNSQAFIICPFIEESESLKTVKAATKEFELLTNAIFPNLKLGLLHGRLKTKEKDQILQEFRDRNLHILAATPVVEVGIDIPNATIIVIEAAERFGLAQLHQLRGRVGRGDKQSFCLLFTEAKNTQTVQRLKAMEVMRTGAELAELDLKLRGPGDMFGTMQHGIKQMKIASFSDFLLIKKSREEAGKVFTHMNEHPLLVKEVQNVSIREISPD